MYEAKQRKRFYLTLRVSKLKVNFLPWSIKRNSNLTRVAERVMIELKLNASDQFVICDVSFSEVYFNSGVPPAQYQKQLEYQLRKLTLGVSVGLVKGKFLLIVFTIKDSFNI